MFLNTEQERIWNSARRSWYRVGSDLNNLQASFQTCDANCTVTETKELAGWLLDELKQYTALVEKLIKEM